MFFFSLVACTAIPVRVWANSLGIACARLKLHSKEAILVEGYIR